MLWHLPDDFKRFKELTSGHHIIMGRKTFDSLPGILPNRTHIVLTRDQNYKNDQVIVVHDIKTAIAATGNDKNPYIIGGGQIYKQAIEIADKIELTRVEGIFDADAYFPDIDSSKWELVNKLEHPQDEKHAHSFTFETYIKK